MIDYVVFVIIVLILLNFILVVIDYNMNLIEKFYKILKNMKVEVDLEFMICRFVVGV